MTGGIFGGRNGLDGFTVAGEVGEIWCGWLEAKCGDKKEKTTEKLINGGFEYQSSMNAGY